MEFLKKKTPLEEPRTLLLIGRPKCGKSTSCSLIPNSLYLDYENGTDFIKHDAVFDVTEAKGSDWKALTEVADKFDFAVVDSCTSMEHWISEQIVRNHNRSVPEAQKIASITEIPYGQGYGLLRTKTIAHLEYLLSMFKRIVFIGHSKDKQISDNTIVLDLDLTGKNAPIFMSRMDAIGFLHRNKDNLEVSFSAEDGKTGGSRIQRLEGETFAISTKTQKGILAHWHRIYPSLDEPFNEMEVGDEN